MARRKTREEFIRDAVAMHGDKYDYSQVVYVQAHKSVIITCNKCKLQFNQIPSAHTSGRNCPACALQSTLSHTRRSVEHYLPRLKEIHGDKYNYDNFTYKNYHTKGAINCDCGETFLISIDKLIRGQGCSNCSSGGYKAYKPCYFYILKVGEDSIKCGITVSMRNRLNRLNLKSTLPIDILYMFHFKTSSQAKELEDTIKYKFTGSFIDKNSMLDGYTETYYWKDIGEILKIALKFSDDNDGILTVK